LGEIFEKYYEIKPSKIRYINNPLPNKNHANIEGVIAKDIIWAGRMINKNNVLRLIRVFCDLDQEDFNLVLIGEGELRRSLQDYSNKFGRDKVQVKDKVGRDELRKIISQSYAAIFPAYTDISPNTVLDCLVADTPFIITKEHGYDWLRRRLPEFDPTDDGAIKNALLKLIQPGCRNRLVNDMVSITYSYDFERAANDTIKIFEELTM
ncbi:glycosyltransferase, partial [Patescibacteria group bacterium]|nr:glycosyltransferase [Patescibacteria group bacterium]